MSEMKSEIRDYVSQKDELGNIHISEDVLAVIASAAALEVDGVSSLASSGKDIVELLGMKSSTRGVRVLVEGDRVQIEVTIVIKYGYTIVDVAKAVQDAVSTNVESMSGLTLYGVNVVVGGVAFEKDFNKPVVR